MQSKNNIELEPQQKVWLLEVPVNGQHRFVEGEVIRLTEKQVVIESEMKGRWGASKRKVKRYPDQVFVI